MTIDIEGARPLDRRRRESHPERILIGNEVFVREDIMAAELGECMRTLARRDVEGAPHARFGGVKYRPEKRFHQFLLDTIQVRERPSKRRARS
jgi:hypothetical protein